MNQLPLSMQRIIPVPRDRVWDAWTVPEQLQSWFAPIGYSTPIYTVDLKVGGKYFNCMRSEDGQIEVFNTGTYLEIVLNEKLVLTDSFADKDGNVVQADYYGMGMEYPLVNQLVITLTDAEGGTQLDCTYPDVSGVPEVHRVGMGQGWNECLDRLVELLTAK